MRVCNAGQPNLKEPVPRVSLIYRRAPVNYAKRDAFWFTFCKLFRGTILNFFKLPKYVLAMVYFCEIPHISPRVMKCPFQSQKTFSKPCFSRLKKID